MDEDIPARRHAELACAFPISSIRIRNVQGAMELAMQISAVDHVHALWCSVIALPVLGPKGLSSKRDLVALEHLASVHQLHCAGALVNADAVGMRSGK